jgi:ligand-binding sensor domain-containing protein
VNRLWRIALPVVAVALAAFVSLTLWQARRALQESAGQVAEQGRLRFTVSPLEPAASSAVEWVSSPAVFTDAASYHGLLYIAGPAGLLAYGPEGQVVAHYRAGQELPPAPVVSLATGAAIDSAEPELFLATAGAGLVAFNGRSFRHLLPEDPLHRQLTSVLVVGSGRMLLGTEKGVLVYDGKTLAPFHPGLAELKATALAGDEASLWVGTLDQGVVHWYAGQIERFAEAEGLPDPRVTAIAVGSESVYVGTPLGVAEFRGGRFHRGLASGFFARSLMVRGERLVVGTLEEGTVEVPLAERRPRSLRQTGESLPGAVGRLLELEGVLHALADDGLYALRKGGGWQRVLGREVALLADRNIAALAFDPVGRLWIGYFDHGLDILEAGGQHASHVDNERVFCVNRIVPDPERNLMAVATANGLVLFDAAGRQRQVLGRAEGLIADHVTDVALYPGGMAVATPAGLTFLDGAGARSLYVFHGLVNNHAYALAAQGNQLMVGTLGGLSVVEGGFVRANFTTANSGLRHNWITAIASLGDEWLVGTYGSGVLRLDESGHWHTFADLRPDFEVNPNAMLVTPARVYAGTLDRGLLVYDRQRERWTAVRSGLPSVNITALAAHDGYLYVGGDNGLVRVREEELLK